MGYIIAVAIIAGIVGFRHSRALDSQDARIYELERWAHKKRFWEEHATSTK